VSTDLQFSRAVEAFRRGDLSLARELAEQAVSITPTPRWHHLVGLIHCRQGDAVRGVEHLGLAVEAEPTNAGFKVMLARAHIDSGNPAAVLQMEKPPSAPTPAELALWHARAEAAGAIGSGAEAVEAWTIVANHSPTDPEAWINLGRSLLAANRFREAKAAYLQALGTSPCGIPALLELGLIYERTNELHQLGELLESALRNGVGKDELGYLWAVWELRAGRLGSARELLLESEPTQDPARWHRLRAKIADKEGDTEVAFDSTVAMNQAMPDFDGWRIRASAFRLDLRELAGAITPEWAARIPLLGASEDRAPVFLVGFPRSGTTLLDTFLMGHPSIAVLEEKEILRRAGEVVGPQKLLPDAPKAVLEKARHAYLEELGQRVGANVADVVIDKHPLNMIAAPLIHALFPGTPIIFAQRHPCDVVLSGFMQSFAPNLGMASFLDLSDSADLYDAAMSIWSSANDMLPLNVHTVVYEELIGDAESQLRPVIEFLGLAWDDRLLRHRATAKDRGAIMNTSYDQVTEELTSAAVGRWRRYEKQLEAVLPVLLPWAERLGNNN
jgi:tetratricopeptide (TPR) repeat protein